MLVQDIELQLVRPPVSVRRAAAGSLLVSPARYRGLAFFIHNISSFYLDLLKLCFFYTSVELFLLLSGTTPD
jgi:hypothetical protein